MTGGMFTDIHLECAITIAGVPLLLLAQWQRGRLRWAVCSDYAALWSGWAGSA